MRELRGVYTRQDSKERQYNASRLYSTIFECLKNVPAGISVFVAVSVQ
jgi:hypothetical protein